MNKSMMVVIVLVIFGLFLIAGAIRAQTGSYELSWWTIDSGGGAVSAGAYAISGGAGQADAHSPLTAGAYAIAGGFWIEQPPATYVLYLPVQRK